MDKTIHGSSACIQPPFSEYMYHRTQLRGKPSAPFETALSFGNIIKISYLLCICTWFLPLKYIIWEYIRAGTHKCVAAHRSKP
jgi:hypothetical protein